MSFQVMQEKQSLISKVVNSDVPKVAAEAQKYIIGEEEEVVASEGNAGWEEAKQTASTAAGNALRAGESIKANLASGPITMRWLSAAGGFGMLYVGVLGLINIFDPLHALIEAYLALAGLIIVTLEFRHYIWAESTISAIRYWARFLETFWGRGFLYNFIGLIALVQNSSLNFILGLYLILIGTVSIFYGFWTARKLNEIQVGLKHVGGQDPAVVKSRFEQYTTNGGRMSKSDLKHLAASLGVDMDQNELNGAIQRLDTNASGTIEWSEFEKWWYSRASWLV